MDIPATLGSDAGLLLLRLVVGFLMIGHGLQKAFGSFGGLGLEGTAPLFEAWGFRPARRNVMLAATVELIAAPMLILGLLTPLACAMIVGVLLVAASVVAGNGLWATRGGFELPMIYALVTAALALTGPGRFALDQVLGLAGYYSPAVGVGAIAVAILAAYVFIAAARRTRAVQSGGA